MLAIGLQLNPSPLLINGSTDIMQVTDDIMRNVGQLFYKITVQNLTNHSLNDISYNEKCISLQII